MPTTQNPGQIFTRQITEIIEEYEALAARSRNMDKSDTISSSKRTEMVTKAFGVIARTVGRNSVYWEQATKTQEEQSLYQDKVGDVVGVLRSLRHDLEAGYLKSFEELVHGELFSDFLEMASHLLEGGYKDAAAVIAGSALESHLRQLAKRLSVPVSGANARPKKADHLNADLTKASAYTVLDQKNVTAWLDLRNNAAHGNYNEYQKEQVALMIDAIQNFMTRHPA